MVTEFKSATTENIPALQTDMNGEWVFEEAVRGSVCALTSKAYRNLSHILLHPSLLSLHKSTGSVYKVDILPQRNCFLPFTFQKVLSIEHFTLLADFSTYVNLAFYFAFCPGWRSKTSLCVYLFLSFFLSFFLYLLTYLFIYLFIYSHCNIHVNYLT